MLSICHNAGTKMVSDRRLTSLTVDESSKVTAVLLRKTQSTAFEPEIEDLKAHKSVGRHSVLRTLNPFIDHDGQRRVGGQFIYSDIAYTR